MSNLRAPLPPPFAVGARLRCVNKSGRSTLSFGSAQKCDRYGCNSDAHPECWVVVYRTGLEVTIDSVKPGRRGTGRIIDLGDGNEPFEDTTRDGYSVYHIPGTQHGRVINVEDKDDWEEVRR